ncbi:MAG: hypothetical protein LBR64_06990 [Dysgonamonadaceae bacterium]|jgi:hypothetical protein|nr:hypothetical protein [Dysgonamonadaceae bacterium]
MNVKNLLPALASLLVMTAFSSCDKNNDWPYSDVNLTAEDIIGKWDVENVNSKYASFEFTKDGDYIVVENSSGENGTYLSYRLGTYTINANKIVLSAYGTVEAVKVPENGIFNFLFAGSDLTALKVSNVSSSAKTDLICRSWALDTLSVDSLQISEEDRNEYYLEYGENWLQALEQQLYEDNKGISFLFTKAGTCILTNKDAQNLPTMKFTEWKWTQNSGETAISLWDDENDAWAENYAQVLSVSDKTLELQKGKVIYYYTAK